MIPDSVYGYAKDSDVDEAIRARMSKVNPDSKKQLADILGQAIFALLEINNAIPVQSKHRHLVANALEQFADGPAT